RVRRRARGRLVGGVTFRAPAGLKLQSRRTTEEERMAKRIGGHLRSNAIAYVALFFALGGAAWAAHKAPKNSVVTKSIKKNAVTNPKLHADAVTGDKVNESTLGTVPDAAQLGGSPPSAFYAAANVQRIDANVSNCVSASNPGCSPTVLGAAGGAFKLSFTCAQTGSNQEMVLNADRSGPTPYLTWAYDRYLDQTGVTTPFAKDAAGTGTVSLFDEIAPVADFDRMSG